MRTMNVNEWLTNEKVQDILERIQAVTKKGRNSGAEATRAIGDTINDAQMGMDQAFIAGTLATPAGVARKDSLEHAQEISDKDVSLAAAKARTYLKQATDKAKALAEDDFKQVRHWLETDEDTLIITTDFLRKIRIEAKRSLRLTNDKIRNPGSLGANPKKKLPSKNAYPSLQITKEEPDTFKGKHTKEWIGRDHDVMPTAPTEDDEADPDAKPPNYESVQQRVGQQRSYVHFGNNIIHDMQPPMMATNGMWYPPANTLQYPPQATGHIHMSKEWIEEQKENTRQMLEVRGVPPSVWDYYIEAPKDWASDDVDTIGVHNGVRNILMSQRSVRPWWVQDSSLGKMVELKNSFTKVVQALEEVDRFIGEDMPEDSQLNSEYNRAEKRANKLHDRLQDACNELSTALVTPDHSFGYEFYDYISEFVEETRDNDKARKRVAEMKSRLPLEALSPIRQTSQQNK